MHKVAQIAFSGLSGASDVCAALAIAGQKSGVPQTLAFWGTEPVVEARMKRCADTGIETAAFSKKRGIDAAGQQAVRQWASDNSDADAFVLHYPAALFAVRKAMSGLSRRPPIVAIEHHPNQLKRPHEWLLSILLLWSGDGVVYLTEAYRTEVARRLGPLFSLRKHRTTVISNGIELDRYQAPATAKTPGQFVIGMSGRMNPVKDYTTLLRAFAALRKEQPALNPCLEIAGDGPMRADLESLAASLGVSEFVTFLGLMAFEDLLPRMRSWDAFVLSTHGETQPLALMEAMACGLPCIGSAVAGVVDVVRDGENGILVPESDPAALASALGALAADAPRRVSLSRAALQCAQAQFSSITMWDRFKTFIGKLSL